MLKKLSAFSLIEVSIVILVIGILVAGITQSSRLIAEARLHTAQTLTVSSTVASITNLILWLEPTLDGNVVSSSAASPEDGHKVSAWNDNNPQLTIKTNLAQATDSMRPLYKTNILSGLPAIKFDGTNDYFSISNIISRNYSIFVVMKTSVAGATGHAYLGKQIITSEVAGVTNDIIPLSIGGGFVKAFTGNPDSTLTGSVSVSNNTAHIICTTRNETSGARTIYVDGTADGSDTSRTGTLNASTSTTIGVDIVNGLYFDGYVGEIIIFDRVLKAEERTSATAYLSKKWSIPVQ